MSFELAALLGEFGETAFAEASPTSSNPQGEAVWTQMVNTISRAFTRNEKLAGAIALLEQRGVDTSSARAVHIGWMERIEELFRAIVRAIRESSAVQSAIDAAAAVANYAQRIVGLADVDPTTVQPLHGTWRKIVRSIDPDLQKSAASSSGVGELGWVALVVPAFTAAWPTIAPILMRVVVIGGTYLISSNIASIVSSISGEVENRGEALEKCLENAKKFTDRAQAQSALDACNKLANPASGMNWLLLGGAVGVAGLLYYQNKKR